MLQKDTLEINKKSLEDKLIKKFILLSVFAHIIILMIHLPDLVNTPPREELEIEIEIEASFQEELFFNAHSNKNTALQAEDKSTVDQKKTLPQLPKKLQIRDETEENTQEKEVFAEKKDSEAPKTPEEVNKVKEELAKVEDIKKLNEEKKLKIEQDKTAMKLYKKDLMARLKREQDRLKSIDKIRKDKVSKDNQVQKKKLDDIITKRSENLGDFSAHGSEGSQLVQSYAKQIRSHIKEQYRIPEVYDLKSSKKPIVFLLIDSNGGIKKIRLEQSSGNASLDKIALQTVEKAAPFPTPPTKNWSKAMEIVFDPATL